MASSPADSRRPGSPEHDDPPPTTPRPDESEGEAAARIAREADPEQDPWGEPEDQPDHDANEVYVQQDATGGQ